ncbi:peptidase M4 [Thiorhodococcus mannitoliphagus]|uniref:Peptidase M4 n=1 Tax=Thiorhodococcus mannitoliphagus TaxID=329406 RepID=A0A6P1DRK0_9GAMM|nr:PepSY domain-containing protein [Thiorhodococcus mannitoliphagus]NEX20170.1 peptidase M4 [Thiorhodococcus mannitoliphagus]
MLKPLGFGLILATLATPCVAGPGGHDHDHDRARHARERGEVRPIEEILAATRAAVPGEIIGLELEREHGHWVYEIKVITQDGRLLEVMVDGADARVLGWELD